MVDNAQSLQALQIIFGVVFILMGMILISPQFAYSGNTTILFIAVALLCFRDGLVQLISAVINIAKKE